MHSEMKLFAYPLIKTLIENLYSPHYSAYRKLSKSVEARESHTKWAIF